jgi:hypothetical protein
MMLVIIATLFYFSSGISKEIVYLQRSPKALLMGDAFTATADDEFSLFYNPAALGRNDRLSLSLVNPQFGITNLLDDQDRFTDFPKTPEAIADRVLGFPVYINVGATPSLKFGPFGLALFANQSTSFVLRNAIHPVLELNHRLDRGFIIGYAHTWGTKPKSLLGGKTITQGKRVTVGVSGKSVNRQGIFQYYDLYGTTLLNRISELDREDVDVSSIRRSLGFSKGKGFGADLGMQAVWGSSLSELSFGLSFLDIGGVSYRRTEGVKKIPKQEMIVATGLAWRQNIRVVDYTLSLDLHPMNQGLEFARMVHLGAELSLPVVSLLAGWNGGYLSYGASIKFWPFKLVAGFYSVELGRHFRQERGNRAVIQLSLFDLTF